MKTFPLPQLAAVMLLAAPTLAAAQDATVAPLTETELTALGTQERAMFEYQLRNAETPEQAKTIRAQIRNHIEAHKAEAQAQQEKVQAQTRAQERVRENLQNKDQVMAEGDAVKVQAKTEKGFMERMFDASSNAKSDRGGRDGGGSDRSGRSGGGSDRGGRSGGGGGNGGGR